jgi:hypothetical protein
LSSAAIDPATVKLPNQDPHFPRSVASASDAELDQHELADLEHVRQLAEQHGFGPLGDDGLPASEVVDWGSEPTRIAADAINRAAPRVRAYRIERQRRAEASLQKRDRDVADAIERLEATLVDGPATLARLAELGAEATAAFGRVSQLVRDLEVLAALRRIERGHADLRAAVRTAATALGREAPAVPALPALPDPRETARLVQAVVGPAAELLRSDVLPRGVSRAKVDEAAALLREAGKDW